MSRIIEIEDPLHLPAGSPGAVVSIENGQRQQGTKLEQTIDSVHGKEINSSIDGGPDQNIQGLLFKIPSVGIKKDRAHDRNAGPVCREGDQADKGGEEKLCPQGIFFLGINHHHHNGPGQRPYHTGLIEISIGNQGKPSGCGVGKVGDDSKEKQSSRIFLWISGIMKALCHEKPHDGCGDPADQMQEKYPPEILAAGPEQPGNVVHSHGDNGNELARIGIKTFLHPCFRSLSDLLPLVQKLTLD